MAISGYTVPKDALPLDIVDAYEVLQEELNFWTSEYYGTLRVIAYFDEALALCRSSEEQVNYICNLARVGGREPGLLLAAGMLTEASFKESYLVWLAVRLTEALCYHLGNSRLRSGRSLLEADWRVVSQRGVPQSEQNPAAVQLVQFLFRVLIPFARGNTQNAQQVVPINEQVIEDVESESIAEEKPTNVAKKQSHSVLSHSLETLCRSPFSPDDLRDLLISLGVLDSETGHWHLGELKGKAAAPMSAFPAAYRALQEANLMLLTDSPVYRKLFVAEFKVDFKDRLANFKDGSPSASASFHEYMNRARQWIQFWKAKQAIFMRTN